MSAEDREAFDEWFTSLSDGHAAFDVWKRGLSEAWQAALAWRDRQGWISVEAAERALRTQFGRNDPIGAIRELGKRPLPAPPAPEDI